MAKRLKSKRGKMGHKKLVIVIVVILLVGQIAAVMASAPTINYLPAWEQANSNGFGDSLEIEVSALEAYKGYLYAGTHNLIDPGQTFDGGRIFRSSDGVTWNPVTQPGFGISHDIKPPAILDFIVFNNRLYASTGWGANPGQIYRTNDGSNWAPMTVTGFSNNENVDISALAIYDGMIYAGVKNRVDGARIYRSSTGDNNTWDQVAPAVPGTDVSTVTGFAEFNYELYAAVESNAPVQIWRFDGFDWTTIVSDGFGSDTTTFIGGMVVFGGYLYVGAGDTVDGPRLYRTLDGAQWDPVITPLSDDANNLKVESLFVFQHQLYVSVKNTATGLELWRSPDGTLWEQVNPDGFGDSANIATNWSNASAEFKCQLYVGTLNATAGGELWRIIQQCSYLPLILH